MIAARRWIVAVLFVALASVTTAGCEKEEHIHEAKTEGPYLTIGPLLYQVQISRQLNPRDSEDRDYLAGLSAADAQLKPNEVFFAVFMRVQNPSNKSHPAAHEYEVTDTVENKFHPLALPPTNVFAYRAREVAAQGLLPSANSAAANGVVGQGAALIFKIPLSSVANRPLVLHITNPVNSKEEGEVDLDV